MTGKRVKTGDIAPNIQVVNADGETIELSSLFNEERHCEPRKGEAICC